LLALGGVARAPNMPGVAVNEPLLYRNGVWKVLPANNVSPPSVRDYHSTAVLLPDGRVMLGGGNGRNYDYEFFLPDYLTYPRPEAVHFDTPLAFVPEFDAYRLDYATHVEIACNELPLGVSLQKVVLMAPGATTHHSDMSQRYVEMEITNQIKPHAVEFLAPPDDKHAPRGIYMLFLVTSGGGVSEAQWVVLRCGPCVGPSAACSGWPCRPSSRCGNCTAQSTTATPRCGPSSTSTATACATWRCWCSPRSSPAMHRRSASCPASTGPC
jgi:hypothetical protein